MNGNRSIACTASPEMRALGISSDHVTLILDDHCRILSCGMAAEKMLGHNRSALCGRPISNFVAGFALGHASPSYRARYFAHLSNCPKWQAFSVAGDDGHEILIELSFSRITTVAGRCIIFLKLRRADSASMPATLCS